MTIDEAFRGAAASIENLVRTIVRDELRRHLGPEADHLLNVKNAPMSARKLRRLVNSGKLRGYRHGRETFVLASDFRAFIEGQGVERPKPLVIPESHPDAEHDIQDELRVTTSLVPTDPVERREFHARVARRRAEGGERAASLRKAEEEHRQFEEQWRLNEARRAKRAENKRLRQKELKP